MEVVIVDVEHRCGLNPQQRRREVKLTRHSEGPREEERVGQASEGLAHLRARGYEAPETVGAAALQLRDVLHDVGVGGGGETVVVAVGERGDGEAVDGFLGFHPTVHVDAGDVGDVYAHGDESLGELEGGVYVPLCRV